MEQIEALRAALIAKVYGQSLHAFCLLPPQTPHSQFKTGLNLHV